MLFKVNTRFKLTLIISALLLCLFNGPMFAQKMTNEEALENEIDTLKFRVNELTRELALLKTAFLKIGGPSAQVSRKNDGQGIFTSSSSLRKNDKNDKNEITEKEPLRSASGNSSQKKAKAESAAEQENKDGGDSVDVEKEVGSVKSNANTSKKKNGKESKIQNSKNSTQPLKLNVMSESRVEINKPIKYNIMIKNQNVSVKRIKLQFVFNETTRFLKANTDNCFTLITSKENSKVFVFKVSDNLKSISRIAFAAGMTGELEPEITLFSDSNKNNIPDSDEASDMRGLKQFVILEE